MASHNCSITDPPTKEELHTLYPAKYTWNQLKMIINSGDLGLLQRHPDLQKRYEECNRELAKQYGSIVNYLANHRLRWGDHDDAPVVPLPKIDDRAFSDSSILPPPYFCNQTPADLISILKTEWPYAVPSEIEHTLIWSKVSVFHPTLIHRSIRSRVDQDGLWGFTGLDHSQPSSPSLLPTYLPSLSELGVTEDDLSKTARPSLEEASFLHLAGREVHQFVRNRWPEDNWETAWFVNPPRLQSVPGLAHIHLFARRKDVICV
ncbi:hypothetical protein BJ165DRAFT_1515253 [Panaeolus papilionaceus]|nr:hypothetical protein BJ165DRAFT_1515253 [Panaeolus papilionaceus]